MQYIADTNVTKIAPMRAPERVCEATEISRKARYKLHTETTYYKLKNTYTSNCIRYLSHTIHILMIK